LQDSENTEYQAEFSALCSKLSNNQMSEVLNDANNQQLVAEIGIPVGNPYSSPDSINFKAYIFDRKVSLDSIRKDNCSGFRSEGVMDR
jgi:hypothetical protein